MKSNDREKKLTGAQQPLNLGWAPKIWRKCPYFELCQCGPRMNIINHYYCWLKKSGYLPINFKYVSGAQKNHLIETVLLSTHNICFG